MRPTLSGHQVLQTPGASERNASRANLNSLLVDYSVQGVADAAAVLARRLAENRRDTWDS